MKDLAALAVPPGNRLERLRADRSGQHSIRINDQYRVCFRWEATAALAAQSRVEPGGSTLLRVTLQTRRDSGRVEREVVVRSNDPRSPLVQVRVIATVDVAKPH